MKSDSEACGAAEEGAEAEVKQPHQALGDGTVQEDSERSGETTYRIYTEVPVLQECKANVGMQMQT